MKLKTIKKEIIYCLTKCPETRNSDKQLTMAVWLQFYSEFFFKDERGNICLRIESIMDLPSQDEIKRIRAEIQNVEHKFVPTNLEVAKKRHWEEEKWRSFLGFNPELRTT